MTPEEAARKQRQEQAERNKARENEGKGFFSSVGKFITDNAYYGAAGVAGTVLAHRSGLSPAISRGLNFSARFASRLGKSTVFKRDFGDWTISDIRRLKSDGKNAWEEAWEKAKTAPLHLDPYDRRNMFGMMSEFHQNNATGFKSMAQASWRQDILNHSINQFTKHFGAQYSENQIAKRYEFMQKIVSNVRNRRDVRKTRKELGLLEDKNIDTMLRYMRYIDNEQARKKYVDDFSQKLAEQVNNSIYDIDRMEKRYGTTRKLGIKERITGTRGVSNREILANKNKTSVNHYQVNGENRGTNYSPLDDIEDARLYFEELDKQAGLNKNAKKGTKAYDRYMKESKEQRFLDLTPDADVLRVDARGNMYSLHDSRKFMNDLVSSFANTLPGKIFKMREVDLDRKMPNMLFAAKGSIDPGLAALSNAAGNKNTNVVDSNMLYVMGDWYRVGDDKIELAKEMQGIETEFVSGRFGPRKHMHQQISGNVRYKKGGNWFTSFFDIGQGRDEFGGFKYGEKYNAWANKENNPNYFPTAVRDLLDPTVEDVDAISAKTDERWLESYLDKLDVMRDNFNSLTYDINSLSAERLLANEGKTPARTMLEQLVKDDYDSMLELLMQSGDDTYAVKELKDLAKKARGNLHDLNSHIVQKVSKEKLNLSTSVFDLPNTEPGNYTEDAKKYLRNLFSREAFAQMARDGSPEADYTKVLDKISQAGLEDAERINANRLADLTYLDDVVRLSDKGENGKGLTLGEEWDLAEGVNKKLVNTTDRMDEQVREDLANMAAENAHLFDTPYMQADEIANPLPYNQFVTQRKTVHVTDLLTSVTEGRFMDTAKQFGKQFTAGRGNMGDVTNATYVPYFFLSRLSDEMNKVGLGFSKDNMGSTTDMLTAMFTKRIIPVAVGATYLEWMDDTSEEITGMSMSGAMAQGVAEFDIAGRKVLDTLGLTDWLKGEKAINPIMQYWGDHDDFMNADERREWYQKGYTPVRKGAWWTFGGVNEARGSEISYWEPTFARRIQSDWKDKALYDGYWDKWSHSLLPTPTNPFSPIAGILDPYWLEEKHKEDRPYELTGHMFADGTPWGAVLNPTIGELIKPQKSLNTFLGFDYRNINGVDPKALLYGITQNIKQKARDIGHRNYIQVNGMDFDPVTLDMFDAPTSDTSVASFQFKSGQYGDIDPGVYGVYPLDKMPTGGGGLGKGVKTEKMLDDIGSTHIGFFEAMDYKLFGGPAPKQGSVIATDGKGNGTVITTQKQHVKISAEDKLLYNELAGETLYDELTDMLPRNDVIDGLVHGNMLEDVMRGIDPMHSAHAWGELSALASKVNPRRMLASVTASRKAESGKTVSPYGVDEDETMIHGDKLKSYRPSQAMDFLSDPDAVTQLINQTKGAGVVENAAVSWRLISGIYGYALGAATGFGVDDMKRIATGQDMTSFSRSFWDENLGGLGGAAAEIARRFVPDYRRGPRNNPLMNTMPDWLPERFRFGDPFTQIQKGEMRLPGKGYESLNELHPDQYGEYGAFDRMKILADIAPFSPEYRLWRDIAKKTVTDPALLDEMDEIRDRVNQQGKKHDFYDYKVVGKGLEYQQVIVSEVMGYGKFRSGNRIFKIAGAHLKANAQESAQEVLNRYIHVGETVTVAVDEDEYARKNKDAQGTLNAAVFADGMNIGQEMIKNGDASIRKGDTSAAATLANYGPVQKMVAWGSEYIAHMDIPWLSDQFLRVRSPLESYDAEQVYGTPYQSWEHPINSILMPALERAAHDRSAFTGMLGNVYRFTRDLEGASPWMKHAGAYAFIFGDRGAFIGNVLGNALGLDERTRMNWSRYGSSAMTLVHAMTGGNSYTDEALSMANLGQEVGRFFEKNGKTRAIYGAIGAAAGILYHGKKNPNGDWIPERTKEKWEMQDYFDRLTYLKYEGLFHAAAEKAKEEEDIDLEDVIELQQEKAEKNQKALSKYKSMKKKLQQNSRPSTQRDELMKKLNAKIADLEGDTMILPGGEWTRTALLYKKAADATMYALDENSSWSQIVTALPTNDREYFMEFVKEVNPDKRNVILNKVSPFLRKALQLAWGQTVDEQEDNETFFAKHELPVANWAGWAPQYDLNNIEVKTIENEAMNLSDFGYYDSQARDEKVINAPTVNYRGMSRDHNEAAVKNYMEDVLKGAGLKDVDISVEAGPTGGGTTIWAAVKQMMGIRTEQKMVENSLSMQSSY